MLGGLGDLEKCDVVRNTIRSSRCDVCCLQETKWNSLDPAVYATVLPTFFERNCVVLKAMNLAGGCIIAWKRNYSLISAWASKHSCSAVLKQNQTGAIFTVTNVYGPSTDEHKRDFIEELHNLAEHRTQSWVLLGDFNLIRWIIDRSSDSWNFHLMDAFNDLISSLHLMDIPLKNRDFTWSSKRPTPTFSRLDSVFITPEWLLNFPIVTLTALEMVTSDHVPLILSCKQRQCSAVPLRMELFWLNYPEVGDKVREIWSQHGHHDTLSFQSNTQEMLSELRSWHKQRFDNRETQLENCKRAVLFFDQIEEKRPLDQREFSLRIKIKERAYELANIEEQMWHQ
ncbi:uncharacterized protein LOC144560285 [Carex rostrata]